MCMCCGGGDVCEVGVWYMYECGVCVVVVMCVRLKCGVCVVVVMCVRLKCGVCGGGDVCGGVSVMCVYRCRSVSDVI